MLNWQDLSGWFYEAPACICEAADWLCKNTNCVESIRDYVPDLIEDGIMDGLNFAASYPIITTIGGVVASGLLSYTWLNISSKLISECIRSGDDVVRLSKLLESPLYKLALSVNTKEFLRNAIQFRRIDMFKHLLENNQVPLNTLSSKDINDLFWVDYKHASIEFMYELHKCPRLSRHLKPNTQDNLIDNTIRTGDIQKLCCVIELPHIHDRLVNNYGYRALYQAIESGHLNILNFLLSIESIQNIAHTQNNSLILFAIRQEQWEIVLRFLELPEVIKHIDIEDNYVLYNLILMNRFQDANRLLDEEHVRTKAAASNNRALSMAAQVGSLELVNRLLEIPDVMQNVAIYGNNPLNEALTNGHMDIAARLLQIPNVYNRITSQNLNQAVIAGNLDIVNRMLECPGVERLAVAKDNEALNLAVRKRNRPLITRLLNVASIHAIYKYSHRQRPIHSVEKAALFEDCKAVYLAKKGLRQFLPRDLAIKVLFFAYHDRYCGKKHCQEQHEAIYIKPRF